MNKKGWIIFAAVCVLLLGGLVALSLSKRLDVSKINTTTILGASSQAGNIADHVYGNADSTVILVEYGDYQCPGCESAYPHAKAISTKYKDQIAFVFRNFPLTTIHPNAKAAAGVAEAAGLQGKYWEMHDKLYDNQSSWGELSIQQRGSAFTDYASQLGLNSDQFTTDLGGSRVNEKISFDQALGKKDGVTGTPSFYLNGKVLDQYVKDGKLVAAGTDGSTPVWNDTDAFDTLIIQPALKAAGIALPQS